MKSIFFQSLQTASSEIDPTHWCDKAEMLIAQGEPHGLKPLLHELGVPVEALLQSPFSAAIALRGYQDGRRFVHHERRGYLPMPPGMLPDQSVSSLEDGVPQWADGIRRSPKYFSFGLDAVFPPYDPNYRSKWVIHELLHMLCGFHWSSDLTPFELYLSARISELLPVVHWYGLDEMYRQRCEKHHGLLLYRQHCQACESSFDVYWKTPLTTEMRLAALNHANHALQHFESELEACTSELETGKLHPTPRPGLDSSSDARGYLRGHYNRLTSWGFGAWMELFMRAGLDYHQSIASQVAHTQSLFKSLMGDAIPTDPALSNRRYSRRRLQDFGSRALMALEWVSDEDVIGLCLKKIEHVATLAEALIAGDESNVSVSDVLTDVTEVFNTHRRLFPDSVVDKLLHFGLPFDGTGIESIALGLKQSLPETLRHEDVTNAVVSQFVSSPTFVSRYSLRQRYSIWSSTVPSLKNNAVNLEAWLLDGPFMDTEAEEFGVIPMEKNLPTGVLRLNETVRISAFDSTTINEMFGWTEPNESTTLIRVYCRGELRIRPIPDDCLLSPIHLVALTILESIHLELIEEGYLVFLPSPL